MQYRIVFVLVLVLAAIATPVPAQHIDDGNYAHNTPGDAFYKRARMFHRNGDFDGAAANYRHAARWGDKRAQFALGVMHVNGEGLPRNPLLGWAWIQLSAERGYRKYQAVADEILGYLTAEQQERARQILVDELEPRCGDAVAWQRAGAEMHRERSSIGGGGSRVGAASKPVLGELSGLDLVDGAQLYDPDLWEPERIAEYEKRKNDGAGEDRVVSGEPVVQDDDKDSGLESDGNPED